MMATTTSAFTFTSRVLRTPSTEVPVVMSLQHYRQLVAHGPRKVCRAACLLLASFAAGFACHMEMLAQIFYQGIQAVCQSEQAAFDGMVRQSLH